MADLFGTPEMAAGYANARPAVHPLVIARVRDRLEITQPVERALDIGCGAGLSTVALQQIARHCTGLDPYHTMLRWAPAKAPCASFAAGRAEALPVRSRSIDLITAAGSLNFADLDLFFSEALRVLAPGGVLVVYDFSEGRSFRGSPSLDAWYDEFWRQYPPATDFAQNISPESLARSQSGFRLTGHEYFEVGLELAPDFYLDYVMSETNVAAAVRDGVPEREIRAWCAETLAPVFGGVPREVLFRGYVAYMGRQ